MINGIKRFICFILLAFAGDQNSYAQVIVKFNVTANGKPLVLNDSSYTNAFNETYQVSRLKYYISDLTLEGPDVMAHYEIPSLIETGANDSISLPEMQDKFTSLEFVVGVDSALNCSGAQEGALDPLNGMFWTWNSGYIFFKLEGYSSASTADLQRIEHHIGGYRYPDNVAKKVKLQFREPLVIKPHEKKIIHVTLNLDYYWNGWNPVMLAKVPLVMKPGKLASIIAINFADMFQITAIE